jgi:hypothetical protein
VSNKGPVQWSRDLATCSIGRLAGLPRYWEVEMLKDLKRTDPEAPIVSYRCEFHDPVIGLIICERRYGGSCEHLRPKSREGCVALQWVAHMRDRGRVAHCYERPNIEEDRFEKGWSE